MASVKPAHRRRPVTTPNQEEDRVHQMKLPAAHMYVLACEAKLFSVTRGQFLTMLLRRKVGLIGLTRGKNAPTYKFKPEEFQRLERYAWYMSEEDMKRLEEDRLSMGNIQPSAWAVFALNDWIGKPGGLR